MIAAIYVRVSTVEQAMEGYSISAQISLLTAFAQSFGYKIYKIYQDAGISGKNISDRPALKELIFDAGKKKFETVLVWKLSRLSRSLLDLLNVVDTFSKNGVSFQSYSEKFDTSTPIGKMLLQLLGSIAEFERNTIAENVKMGLNERFKQGYSKGSIPFGYKNVNKQAAIDDEKAEIVRYIFNTYLNSLDGKCLTKLAEELNDKGFRTRTGGLWSRNVVRDMLINHFYAGYVRSGIHPHGKRLANASVVKGNHEAIITDDIFNKVNSKLASKKHETVIRYPGNDSILTGLVKCPLCGAKMFALNTHYRYQKKSGDTTITPVRKYRCNNKDKGKGICKGIYVEAKDLESSVLKTLNKIMTKGDMLKVKTRTDEIPVENEYESIERELRSCNTLKNKYMDLFETGKVDMEKFADKINEIFDRIEKLERKKEQFLTSYSSKMSISDVLGKIKDFNALFKNLSNPDKKMLLREFIQEIEITRDRNLKYILFKSGQKIFYH